MTTYLLHKSILCAILQVIMVVIVSMRETHVTVHRVRILAAVRHYLLMMEGHLITDVTVNMDIKVCYCHAAVTMLSHYISCHKSACAY